MEELAKSVLRQNLDTVRESSVDPVGLSVKLYSIGIIGDTDLAKAGNAGESEANRRTGLVCTLMGNGGPNVFQNFIQILLNQKEVNWLGKKLKDEFLEAGGVWRKISPHPQSRETATHHPSLHEHGYQDLPRPDKQELDSGVKGLDATESDLMLESSDREDSTPTRELVGHKRTAPTIAVPGSSHHINITAPQQVNAACNTEETSCKKTDSSSVELAKETEEENEISHDLQPRFSYTPQSEDTRRSKFKENQAMVYQGLHLSLEYVLMNKLEDSEERIANLERQVEGLVQKNEQLNSDFARFQQNTKDKDGATNAMLQDKMRHLEDCQRLRDWVILQLEKAQETIRIQQGDIDSLKENKCKQSVRLAGLQNEVNLQKEILERNKKEIAERDLKIANQKAQIERLKQVVFSISICVGVFVVYCGARLGP